jgi:type IV pilus assembly protein PilA
MGAGVRVSGHSIRDAGFTLIELMIVVGIIGILVAIATPNFLRYQAKARQTEAKIGLAAIYLGEKSFFSEYSVYLDACEAIGYTPEGQKRIYAIGFSGVANAANALAVGYNGAAVVNGYDTLNAPYTSISADATNLSGATAPTSPSTRSPWAGLSTSAAPMTNGPSTTRR